MAGNPTARAILRASDSSAGKGGVAGMTGTPAFAAKMRASILLPSLRMVSGCGPTNVIPAAAHASANSGLSDKNP